MATLRTFESSGTIWQLTRHKSPKDFDLLVWIPSLTISNRLILIIDTVCVLCEVLSESLQVIQRNVSPLPRLTHFPTLFLKSSPPLPDGRAGTGWRSSSRDALCRTSGNMAYECTFACGFGIGAWTVGTEQYTSRRRKEEKECKWALRDGVHTLHQGSFTFKILHGFTVHMQEEQSLRYIYISDDQVKKAVTFVHRIRHFLNTLGIQQN
jgi:hypothetical protein